MRSFSRKNTQMEQANPMEKRRKWKIKSSMFRILMSVIVSEEDSVSFRSNAFSGTL